MKFVQFYLDCLSHASYLVGDETSGRAVVIDPQRDVSQYINSAARFSFEIELVIETHFHADFLSGHLELAEATGARIAYSAAAQPEFDVLSVSDGYRHSLGEVVLEFRHTPGHTPESMSIVVYERDGDEVPYGVLTGDTLFIGDVGRPDLLGSIGFTEEQLANDLYESLHAKLLTLPDATRVYPAHGAGSACGKNLSTDLWSTIGDQKVNNYALRARDKDTFIALVTEGQPPAPGYFPYNAVLNQKNRPLLDESQMPAALSFEQVVDALADGAVLLDGRAAEEFALGHLKQAINIGLGGRYAEFAGSVLSSDADIVLFVEPGDELEAKNRLARIGFDRVVGYLAEPYRAMLEHPEQVRVASRLTANAFFDVAAQIDDLQVIDVRNPGEAAAGMLPRAINIPVVQLGGRLKELDISELDRTRPTVVYCAGGYRSSVAASVLRQNGFQDVSDILGGYNAYEQIVQGS